jgi:hypothetical protein
LKKVCNLLSLSLSSPATTDEQSTSRTHNTCHHHPPKTVNMSSVGRVIRRLGSSRKLHVAEMISTDTLISIPEEAPQVNLAPVDTQLNMHRFNALFEEEMGVQGPKGWLLSKYISSQA